MYKDFYFEVTRNGRLIATFQTRWQAEKFAEEYKVFNYIVTRINL
jgi:hypothetical protein